ncbi:unnamed protein product, partial [marine sediment metagenome]
ASLIRKMRGRTLRKLGIDRLSVTELTSYVTEGHRYIFEDVPMSLVPIASMAQGYGVSVRGMESIIRLACIIHRTDYWKRGRTLRKLGIDRLSVTELTSYVTEGHREY